LPIIQELSLTLKAKLFHGLADPSRLAIVEALRSGEKTVTELVTMTRLSQPNASAHLACLRDCGLVASRQEGRYVFYALSDARMEALLKAASGIVALVSERISCCSNYECQTGQKCASNRNCAAPIEVAHSILSDNAVTIPLEEGHF
jgi:DNA-binding transcriptional ArsR family regulator